MKHVRQSETTVRFTFVSEKNSIILTSRSATEGTLAHDLILNGGGRVVDISIGKRVKLTGRELEEYKNELDEE